MLYMQSEIKASNQLLLDWTTKLQQKQSLVSPSYSQSHVQPQGLSFQQGPQHIPQPSHSHHNHSPRGVQDIHTTLATKVLHHTDGSPHTVHYKQINARFGMTDLPQDAVLPSLEVMRQLPNVSQAMSSVLLPMTTKADKILCKVSQIEGEVVTITMIQCQPS